MISRAYQIMEDKFGKKGFQFGINRWRIILEIYFFEIGIKKEFIGIGDFVPLIALDLSFVIVLVR